MTMSLSVEGMLAPAVLAPPSVGRAASVEVVRDAAGVAALGDEWQRLEDAGTARAPSQRHAWATLAVAAGSDLRIVVVREAGEIRLVMPLVVRPWFGCHVARWLGEPLGHYGDALACASVAPAHIETAFAEILGWTDIDALVLHRIRADAVLAPHMPAVLQASRASEAAPYIPLAGYADLADFRDRSPSHGRRRRRADRLKLAAQGPLAFSVARGSAALARLDAVGIAAGEDIDALRAVLAKPEAGGVVAGLDVGGRPAATEIGFVLADQYCAHLSVVDPAFARGGAGGILMEDLIGWCIGHGLARYDLMPPADGAKLAWTQERIAVRDYSLPLSRLGRIFLKLHGGPWKPHLKRLHARTPPGLRSLASRMIRSI